MLEQFSHFETISLYKGFISPQTLLLLESKNLVGLKLQNVTITEHKFWLMIKQILENKNLRKLKMVSHDYEKFPHPIMIMSDIVGHLPNCTLNIEFLKFTLDQHTRILYRNLRQLKKLKKLTIFYNVQESTYNLDEIILMTASLSDVEVKFIEYVCRYNTDFYTAKMVRRSKDKSIYYLNVIESIDKYMDVFPINYDEYFGM